MNGTRTLKRLESTAYHEAGHAVAAFYMSKNFLHVTIVPGEGYASCVKHYSPKFIKYFEGWSFERQRNFLENLFILKLAGHIAQKKFSPQSVRRYQTASDEDHQIKYFFQICSFDPREGDAYWKRLEIRTENMIELHWKDVIAVANSLLERKTLTYEDVYEIIRDSPIPEFPIYKNWVDALIEKVKCGKVAPQEAVDAAEAQVIEANTKEEEKWLLRGKRYNINRLKKELRREGFVCKEVWQDKRSA